MPTPYEQRRQRLLASAARVFAERGYHRASMRLLARAAGISLSGIYYYVKGKEDLLCQIQAQCLEAVERGAREAIGRESTSEGRLAAFIRHHVTFFTSHMSEMKVLSHEASSLSGGLLALVTTHKRRYVDAALELLVAVEDSRAAAAAAAGAAESNGGGRGRPVDRRVAVYALFGMMNWIYTWYDPEGPVGVHQLAEDISRLFLDGFTAAMRPPSSAVAPSPLTSHVSRLEEPAR